MLKHYSSRNTQAMFSTLLKYEQEDYFRDHPIIYFTDAYGSANAYQVMAVVKYSVDDLDEWDFRTRNHEDMESYNAWMEQLQGRALFYEEPDHARPTASSPLPPVTGGCMGKMGGFL